MNPKNLNYLKIKTELEFLPYNDIKINSLLILNKQH